MKLHDAKERRSVSKNDLFPTKFIEKKKEPLYSKGLIFNTFSVSHYHLLFMMVENIQTAVRHLSYFTFLIYVISGVHKNQEKYFWNVYQGKAPEPMKKSDKKNCDRKKKTDKKTKTFYKWTFNNSYKQVKALISGKINIFFSLTHFCGFQKNVGGCAYCIHQHFVGFFYYIRMQLNELYNQ